MLILLQYYIRKVPQEDRKIPGFLAGILDASATFLILKLIHAVSF